MTAVAIPRYFDRSSQSTPVSETALSILAQLLRATSHARENASDWRTLARSCIEQIAEECRADGWDGYGAKAISAATKEQAQALIDLFPFDIARPEILPDPDGEIALCWDFGPDRMFTATISAAGLLSYAGLTQNGEKPHGVESIAGKIPCSVIEALELLHSEA